MTPDAFRAAALAAAPPPPGLSLPLQALWWDARDEWDRAHECAQASDETDAAAVHAYLHRREGDLANAGYWYRRAGRNAARGELAEEWAELVRECSMTE
jgi:hypothetical protein